MYMLRKKIWLNQLKWLVWTTFFDLKKWFVLMKKNLFDSNKISLNQINICLNEKNFVSLKQNISLHQWKCFKQIILLIQSNIFSECMYKYCNCNKLCIYITQYNHTIHCFTSNKVEKQLHALMREKTIAQRFYIFFIKRFFIKKTDTENHIET